MPGRQPAAPMGGDVLDLAGGLEHDDLPSCIPCNIYRIGTEGKRVEL